MRGEIEQGKKFVRENMMDCVIECGPENLEEARANIVLAYRALEDARMRFGKAIQAADGGVSIYDKDKEKPVVANEKADEDT
jgi:hypothetical protein